MKTITHECYVSLEVAKLLKEAGFDWECNRHYTEGRNILFEKAEKGHVIITRNQSEYPSLYFAPTLEVAQRWLREVKAFHIEIIVGDHSDDWGYYLITDIHKPDDMPIINGVPKMSEFYDDFKSYEEAQEVAIKKALEIILKKGE